MFVNRFVLFVFISVLLVSCSEDVSRKTIANLSTWRLGNK